VAYDQGVGAYAARLWWLLRWLGQPAGGVARRRHRLLGACRVAARHGPHGARARGTSPAATAEDLVVTTPALARIVAAGALKRGELTLVDARSADRFAGENETLDRSRATSPARATIRSRAISMRTVRFRHRRTSCAGAGADTLRERRAQTLIAMCGSRRHGLPQSARARGRGAPRAARLYAWSWSEWIRDPARAGVAWCRKLN